jgi:hypothetical protein
MQPVALDPAPPVAVHGLAKRFRGADALRVGSSVALPRQTRDWMAERYLGYYQPYATSHDDLDADRDFQEEACNVARGRSSAR